MALNNGLQPFRLQLLLFCVFISITPIYYALPSGGSVVDGNINITQPNSNYMQINQSTQSGLINWQTFNINTQEHVHFNQPNASALTINRVNPANGSSNILGRLSATGQVFILNPAGVIFGHNAEIDVAGILASTSDINTQAYLNGSLEFLPNYDYNGSIINHGQISIKDNGYAAFVAPTVINHGIIRANLGRVELASGDAFTVDLYGDNLINFKLPPDKVNQLRNYSIDHQGEIYADGGSIIMTAQDVEDVVSSVINMDGYAQANQILERGGEIIFSAGKNGSLNFASNSNIQAGGGKVAARAKEINVAANSLIDVSSITDDGNAGEVTIGGNYQGAINNNSDYNAEQVTMQEGATILANANKNGDGGKIVLWSDGTTQAGGTFQAVSGTESGDGGLIETSGKVNLQILENISISAKSRNNLGVDGEWLLDPILITVDGYLALSISDVLDTGTNVTIATLQAPVTDPVANYGTGTDLNSNNNIVPNVAGIVEFRNDTESIAWNTDANFTVLAGHSITFYSNNANGHINSSGLGNIKLVTGVEPYVAGNEYGVITSFNDLTLGDVRSSGGGLVEAYIRPINGTFGQAQTSDITGLGSTDHREIYQISGDSQYIEYHYIDYNDPLGQTDRTLSNAATIAAGGLHPVIGFALYHDVDLSTLDIDINDTAGDPSDDLRLFLGFNDFQNHFDGNGYTISGFQFSTSGSVDIGGTPIITNIPHEAIGHTGFFNTTDSSNQVVVAASGGDIQTGGKQYIKNLIFDDPLIYYKGDNTNATTQNAVYGGSIVIGQATINDNAPLNISNIDLLKPSVFAESIDIAGDSRPFRSSTGLLIGRTTGTASDNSDYTLEISDYMVSDDVGFTSGNSISHYIASGGVGETGAANIILDGVIDYNATGFIQMGDKSTLDNSQFQDGTYEDYYLGGFFGRTTNPNLIFDALHSDISFSGNIQSSNPFADTSTYSAGVIGSFIGTDLTFNNVTIDNLNLDAGFSSNAVTNYGAKNYYIGGIIGYANLSGDLTVATRQNDAGGDEFGYLNVIDSDLNLSLSSTNFGDASEIIYNSYMGGLFGDLTTDNINIDNNANINIDLELSTSIRNRFGTLDLNDDGVSDSASYVAGGIGRLNATNSNFSDIDINIQNDFSGSNIFRSMNTIELQADSGTNNAFTSYTSGFIGESNITDTQNFNGYVNLGGNISSLGGSNNREGHILLDSFTGGVIGRSNTTTTNFNDEVILNVNANFDSSIISSNYNFSGPTYLESYLGGIVGQNNSSTTSFNGYIEVWLPIISSLNINVGVFQLPTDAITDLVNVDIQNFTYNGSIIGQDNSNTLNVTSDVFSITPALNDNIIYEASFDEGGLEIYDNIVDSISAGDNFITHHHTGGLIGQTNNSNGALTFTGNIEIDTSDISEFVDNNYGQNALVYAEGKAFNINSFYGGLFGQSNHNTSLFNNETKFIIFNDDYNEVVSTYIERDESVGFTNLYSGGYAGQDNSNNLIINTEFASYTPLINEVFIDNPLTGSESNLFAAGFIADTNTNSIFINVPVDTYLESAGGANMLSNYYTNDNTQNTVNAFTGGLFARTNNTGSDITINGDIYVDYSIADDLGYNSIAIFDTLYNTDITLYTGGLFGQANHDSTTISGNGVSKQPYISIYSNSDVIGNYILKEGPGEINAFTGGITGEDNSNSLTINSVIAIESAFFNEVEEYDEDGTTSSVNLYSGGLIGNANNNQAISINIPVLENLIGFDSSNDTDDFSLNIGEDYSELYIPDNSSNGTAIEFYNPATDSYEQITIPSGGTITLNLSGDNYIEIGSNNSGYLNDFGIYDSETATISITNNSGTGNNTVTVDYGFGPEVYSGDDEGVISFNIESDFSFDYSFEVYTHGAANNYIMDQDPVDGINRTINSYTGGLIGKTSNPLLDVTVDGSIYVNYNSWSNSNNEVINNVITPYDAGDFIENLDINVALFSGSLIGQSNHNNTTFGANLTTNGHYIYVTNGSEIVNNISKYGDGNLSSHMGGLIGQDNSQNLVINAAIDQDVLLYNYIYDAPLNVANNVRMFTGGLIGEANNNSISLTMPDDNYLYTYGPYNGFANEITDDNSVGNLELYAGGLIGKTSNQDLDISIFGDIEIDIDYLSPNEAYYYNYDTGDEYYAIYNSNIFAYNGGLFGQANHNSTTISGNGYSKQPYITIYGSNTAGNYIYKEGPGDINAFSGGITAEDNSNSLTINSVIAIESAFFNEVEEYDEDGTTSSVNLYSGGLIGNANNDQNITINIPVLDNTIGFDSSNDADDFSLNIEEGFLPFLIPDNSSTNTNLLYYNAATESYEQIAIPSGGSITLNLTGDNDISYSSYNSGYLSGFGIYDSETATITISNNSGTGNNTVTVDYGFGTEVYEGFDEGSMDFYIGSDFNFDYDFELSTYGAANYYNMDQDPVDGINRTINSYTGGLIGRTADNPLLDLTIDGDVYAEHNYYDNFYNNIRVTYYDDLINISNLDVNVSLFSGGLIGQANHNNTTISTNRGYNSYGIEVNDDMWNNIEKYGDGDIYLYNGGLIGQDNSNNLVINGGIKIDSTNENIVEDALLNVTNNIYVFGGGLIGEANNNSISINVPFNNIINVDGSPYNEVDNSYGNYIDNSIGTTEAYLGGLIGKTVNTNMDITINGDIEVWFDYQEANYFNTLYNSNAFAYAGGLFGQANHNSTTIGGNGYSIQPQIYIDGSENVVNNYIYKEGAGEINAFTGGIAGQDNGSNLTINSILNVRSTFFNQIEEFNTDSADNVNLYAAGLIGDSSNQSITINSPLQDNIVSFSSSDNSVNFDLNIGDGSPFELFIPDNTNNSTIVEYYSPITGSNEQLTIPSGGSITLNLTGDNDIEYESNNSGPINDFSVDDSQTVTITITNNAGTGNNTVTIFSSYNGTEVYSGTDEGNISFIVNSDFDFGLNFAIKSSGGANVYSSQVEPNIDTLSDLNVFAAGLLGRTNNSSMNLTINGDIDIDFDDWTVFNQDNIFQIGGIPYINQIGYEFDNGDDIVTAPAYNKNLNIYAGGVIGQANHANTIFNNDPENNASYIDISNTDQDDDELDLNIISNFIALDKNGSINSYIGGFTGQDNTQSLTLNTEINLLTAVSNEIEVGSNNELSTATNINLFAGGLIGDANTSTSINLTAPEDESFFISGGANYIDNLAEPDDQTISNVNLYTSGLIGRTQNSNMNFDSNGTINLDYEHWDLYWGSPHMNEVYLNNAHLNIYAGGIFGQANHNNSRFDGNEIESTPYLAVYDEIDDGIQNYVEKYGPGEITSYIGGIAGQDNSNSYEFNIEIINDDIFVNEIYDYPTDTSNNINLYAAGLYAETSANSITITNPVGDDMDIGGGVNYLNTSEPNNSDVANLNIYAAGLFAKTDNPSLNITINGDVSVNYAPLNDYRGNNYLNEIQNIYNYNISAYAGGLFGQANHNSTTINGDGISSQPFINVYSDNDLLGNYVYKEGPGNINAFTGGITAEDNSNNLTINSVTWIESVFFNDIEEFNIDSTDTVNLYSGGLIGNSNNQNININTPVLENIISFDSSNNIDDFNLDISDGDFILVIPDNSNTSTTLEYYNPVTGTNETITIPNGGSITLELAGSNLVQYNSNNSGFINNFNLNENDTATITITNNGVTGNNTIDIDSATYSGEIEGQFTIFISDDYDFDFDMYTFGAGNNYNLDQNPVDNINRTINSYTGGLFGKTNNSLTNLNINSDIYIENGNWNDNFNEALVTRYDDEINITNLDVNIALYSGGLIGQANHDNTNISSNRGYQAYGIYVEGLMWNNADKYGDGNISSYNGGLVGQDNTNNLTIDAAIELNTDIQNIALDSLLNVTNDINVFAGGIIGEANTNSISIDIPFDKYLYTNGTYNYIDNSSSYSVNGPVGTIGAYGGGLVGRTNNPNLDITINGDIEVNLTYENINKANYIYNSNIFAYNGGLFGQANHGSATISGNGVLTDPSIRIYGNNASKNYLEKEGDGTLHAFSGGISGDDNSNEITINSAISIETPFINEVYDYTLDNANDVELFAGGLIGKSSNTDIVITAPQTYTAGGINYFENDAPANENIATVNTYGGGLFGQTNNSSGNVRFNGDIQVDYGIRDDDYGYAELNEIYSEYTSLTAYSGGLFGQANHNSTIVNGDGIINIYNNSGENLGTYIDNSGRGSVTSFTGGLTGQDNTNTSTFNAVLDISHSAYNYVEISINNDSNTTANIYTGGLYGESNIGSLTINIPVGEVLSTAGGTNIVYISHDVAPANPSVLNSFAGGLFGNTGNTMNNLTINGNIEIDYQSNHGYENNTIAVTEITSNNADIMSYAGGLFGQANHTATNVNAENINIDNTQFDSINTVTDAEGSGSTENYVGGLVGQDNSQTVIFDGDITINTLIETAVTNTQPDNRVEANTYTGGLSGMANNDDVTFNGNISVNNVESIVDIDDGDDTIISPISLFTGGLIGYNNILTSNSMHFNGDTITIGDSNGGSVIQSQALNDTEGGIYTGGLIGYQAGPGLTEINSNIDVYADIATISSGTINTTIGDKFSQGLYAGGVIGYQDNGVTLVNSSVNLHNSTISVSGSALNEAIVASGGLFGGLVNSSFAYNNTLFNLNNASNSSSSGYEGGVIGYIDVAELDPTSAAGVTTGNLYLDSPNDGGDWTNGGALFSFLDTDACQGPSAGLCFLEYVPPPDIPELEFGFIPGVLPTTVVVNTVNQDETNIFLTDRSDLAGKNVFIAVYETINNKGEVIIVGYPIETFTSENGEINFNLFNLKRYKKPLGHNQQQGDFFILTPKN